MKRYNPRVEQTRKKHILPAWAVTPTFILGIIIVVAALVMAIFPEQIAPYDPTAVDITVRTKAPSAEHIFGTDNYGRDVFSRVVWGTRIDLSIGFFGVLVPMIIGGIIGLLAAWYGGWLDSLLMRISEIISVHDPGHCNHNHSGYGHHQSVYCAVARRLDELCASGARGGSEAEKSRIHRGCAGGRLFRCANPDAPHFAERHFVVHRVRCERYGDVHADGRVDELPGTRRSAADA